ncbi:MAG: hypothetical protein COA43_03075 [Robiginitomaculum sp.]|nr:MAG: hypothetical protein COA43_03075 [Robiginitomaculum sp.]
MKFWDNFAKREKMLIVIAGGLSILFFGNQFLMKPLLAYPKTQKLERDAARADLEIMHKGKVVLSEENLNDDGNEVQHLSAAEMQSEITRSALKHGLVIARRQPNGDSGLSIWLETAPSTSVYEWINALTSTYDVELLRVNINKNDNGSVRLQITFKAGA